MNEVEEETAQDCTEENNIDSVNINSIHFNKHHSVVTAKLKMSAGINNVIVPFKLDTCSSGNVIPLHIYKNYFLEKPVRNWQQQKLKLYN